MLTILRCVPTSFISSISRSNCCLSCSMAFSEKKKRKKKKETFYKNPVTVTYVNATETCLFNSSRHVLCSLTASLFSTHGQFISSNMTFLECTFVILTYLYNWLTTAHRHRHRHHHHHYPYHHQALRRFTINVLNLND